ELADARARLTETEAALAERDDRLGRLDEAERALQLEVEARERELGHVRDELDGLRVEGREREKRLGQLERELAVARSAQSEAENSLVEREDRIHRLEQDEGSHRVEAKALADELEQVRTGLEQAGIELEQLRVALRQSEERHAELEEELQRAQVDQGAHEQRRRD